MNNCDYKYNYCHQDLSNLNDIIQKDGYVVVPSVLTEEEIELARQGLWDTLYNLTINLEKPIKKEDTKSWLTFWELFPLHSMLLKQYVGHSQFVWDLRANNQIKKVFSLLHNEDDLLVSFDGFSFHFPFEHLPNKRGVYRGNEWFHTDQSPHRNINCYQGIINLYDVNEGDATLRVIENSHLRHQQFFKDKEIDKVNGDWYKLDKDETYFADLEKVRVRAKAGDLILWNSKTFHCGGEPLINRSEPNFRLAVYVCMVPRKWATNKQLEKKRKAFNELRMTSHWPVETRLNSKTPRTYGKELSNINQLPNPVVDDETKKLAGF